MSMCANIIIQTRNEKLKYSIIIERSAHSHVYIEGAIQKIEKYFQYAVQMNLLTFSGLQI
jgi:hypothetical protein